MTRKIFSTALAALTAALPAAALDAPRLLSAGSSAQVLAGAPEIPVSLPRDATFERVVPLAQGWLALGTRNTDKGSRLALVVQEGGSLRSLRPPPTPAGLDQVEPVPLLADGRIVGAVWREGADPRQARLRSASWSDGRWKRVETLSGTGPGSQLALSGTVLDDGSWLVLWSAFDGEDDEVMWSHRDGAGWSRPRRLGEDNRVPDITPAVTTLPGGAIAAWSRYDGDGYHLRLARFANGEWSDLGEVAGAGSFAPEWAPGEHRQLLFRDARRGWALLEVGTRGEVLRSGAVAGPPEPRPAIIGRSDEPALWFPDGRALQIELAVVPTR